jgi:hypothetical protein
MYWKEIPAQVQATGDDGTVSPPMDPRFQEGIDAIAMFDSSAGTDDYMDAWDWRDVGELAGDAADVSQKVADHLNSQFPQDFVALIRDSQRAGNRDISPGSLDEWSGGVLPAE